MNNKLHSIPIQNFLKILADSCLIFIFFLSSAPLNAQDNSYYPSKNKAQNKTEYSNKNKTQNNDKYDIIVRINDDILLGGYTETKIINDEPEFIGNVFLLRNHRNPILIKRQAGYMIAEIQNLSLANGQLVLFGFRSPHRAEHYLPALFFVTAGRVPIFSELKFPDYNLPPILYAGKATLSEKAHSPVIQLFTALIHHNAAPPFVYSIQNFKFTKGRLFKTAEKPQFTPAESFHQYANIGTELFQLKLYAQAITPYLKAFQALRQEVYPITTDLRSKIRLNLAICYLKTKQKAQAEVLLKAIIKGSEDGYYTKEAQKLMAN